MCGLEIKVCLADGCFKCDSLLEKTLWKKSFLTMGFSFKVYLSDSAHEWGDFIWNQLETLVMVCHYVKILFKTCDQ